MVFSRTSASIDWRDKSIEKNYNSKIVNHHKRPVTANSKFEMLHSRKGDGIFSNIQNKSSTSFNKNVKSNFSNVGHGSSPRQNVSNYRITNPNDRSQNNLKTGNVSSLIQSAFGPRSQSAKDKSITQKNKYLLNSSKVNKEFSHANDPMKTANLKETYNRGFSANSRYQSTYNMKKESSGHPEKKSVLNHINNWKPLEHKSDFNIRHNVSYTIKESMSNFYNSLMFIKHQKIKKTFPSKLISAKSFLIYDLLRKQILWSKETKARLEIASLTKIMTFLTCETICKELHLDPNSLTMTISEDASKLKGTTAELCCGDTLSMTDLLYGMMVPSGNDAAHA